MNTKERVEIVDYINDQGYVKGKIVLSMGAISYVRGKSSISITEEDLQETFQLVVARQNAAIAYDKAQFALHAYITNVLSAPMQSKSIQRIEEARLE